MPPSNVAVIETLLAPFSDDLVSLFADPARVDELRDLGAPLADPELETTFLGRDAIVAAGPFHGFDGLVAGWRDWLSSFASYRIVVDDVFQDGDRVVVLVRQAGRTLHDDVEVPSSPSAAVFAMRDGRLARVAFYIDRVEAASAEGFELP